MKKLTLPKSGSVIGGATPVPARQRGGNKAGGGAHAPCICTVCLRTSRLTPRRPRLTHSSSSRSSPSLPRRLPTSPVHHLSTSPPHHLSKSLHFIPAPPPPSPTQPHLHTYPPAPAHPPTASRLHTTTTMITPGYVTPTWHKRSALKQDPSSGIPQAGSLKQDPSSGIPQAGSLKRDPSSGIPQAGLWLKRAP